MPTTTFPAHAPARPGRRFFRDLTGSPVGNITPNWFAAVMGTGIVAVAVMQLPGRPHWFSGIALVMWLLAAVVLVVLVAATVAHWVRFPVRARGHHRHPVMMHFWGAVPMAVMTVGSGALLVGPAVIGTRAAVALDAVMWTVGTVLGIGTAVLVPVLAFTGEGSAPDAAFGGWLMPVVPPMVSAATGAGLVDHLPAGQPRATVLVLCYALAGASLGAAAVVVPQIWGRLMHHRIGPAAMVPTLWIVLGPLGQGATAALLLGAHATAAVGPQWGHTLQQVGVLVAVPLLGFAGLWGAIVATVTVRQWRRGLPFALTWWSFTFPVGTCATGAAALATATGGLLPAVIAWVLVGALCGAWVVVAARTFHGSVVRGTLLA